jgi:hypothetical protein
MLAVGGLAQNESATFGDGIGRKNHAIIEGSLTAALLGKRVRGVFGFGDGQANDDLLRRFIEEGLAFASGIGRNHFEGITGLFEQLAATRRVAG